MAALYRYWGKAKKPDNLDDEASCHLLVYHSLDVAAVGQALLQRHPFLLRRLARLMDLPEETALGWILFLLGLHDLGKFAETFQQLREDLRLRFWADERIRRRNYSLRHDSLGMVLWRDHLRDHLFPDRSEAMDALVKDILPEWLAAVFGHHGQPPKGSDRLKRHFRDFDAEAALGFVSIWQALIQPDVEALLDKARSAEWRSRQKEASWLIAGVAVLCDWLGSDNELFRYHDEPMPQQDYWERYALPAAKEAVARAGILPPPVQADASPFDLFGYIEQPTPLQQACAALVLGEEPQLFILEDVTGAGKTEAALILARRLMQAGQGEGLYIGLPTMATANAMYERMAKIYRSLYVPNRNPSLILSHGARHLSKAFHQSLLNAEPEQGGYGDEESIVAQCNRWLADNRKKALLADVGVGTIDQALLGVMPARHQSLRLLGLSNKVLILDEVHAYDAYTREPIKRLLQFHAAFGGSAILLSATLTRRQREEFLATFAGVRGLQVNRTNYPLLTCCQSGARSPGEIPVDTREEVRRKVGVRFCHEEAEVVEVICRAVENGECVCWIRNTVQDARDAWQLLAGQDWMDEDRLHLFHSRYALCDRLATEQAMLERFGKDSQHRERAGRVLIATQVVEQSLDLDFDHMISDLAPIDLLVQRAGRLQRHQRGKRPDPVLHVHTPEYVDDPAENWYKQHFPRAAYVYPHTAVLWRTARLLVEKGGWRMPDDARELVETVYDRDAYIPAELEDTVFAIEGEEMSRRDAGEFSSLRLETGYRDTERWEEEAVVATRLGEETQTLYLACWQNSGLQPWAEEGPYRWDLSSLRVNRKQFRQAAVPEDAEWRNALEILKAEEKLFDESSFVLALCRNGNAWRGKVLDEHDNVIEVTYSPERGLERQS